MEKFKNFPDAILSLFGIDLQVKHEELLFEKASNFLKQDCMFEAFLLACVGFRVNRDPKFIPILEKTSRCKILMDNFSDQENELQKSTVSLILNNSSAHSMGYEAIISLHAQAFSKPTSTLSLLLFKKIKEEQMEFVQQIINFKMQISNFHSGLRQMFYDFCNQCINDQRKEGRLITDLSQKLIGYGQKDFLVYCYWYYTYLGESYIAEAIFSALLDTFGEQVDFQLSFDDDFVWGNISILSLKDKYQKIRTVLRGQGDGDSVGDLLERNKLLSLVLLCLYAKSQGNLKVESFALWYVARQTNSKRVLERMSEISGYQIPTEFREIPLRDRARWLTNKLKDSFAAFESPNPIRYRDSIKKLFTVRPFTLEALKGLMKLDGVIRDTEIHNMLQYSIGKINSFRTLGKLLSYSITTKSEYALRLILGKMLLLNYYPEMLNSMTKVTKYLKGYAYTEHGLVGEVLDFYLEFTPKEQVNWDIYNPLKEWNGHRQKRSAALFSSVEKEEILKDKQVLEIGHQEYKKLLKKVKEGTLTSSNILEKILKSALAEHSIQDVLFIYKTLVIKNSVVASFYNLEVEPYFLQQKLSRETSKIGMGNLISKVWGRPAVLEHPVNRQTFRVTSGYLRTHMKNKKK